VKITKKLATKLHGASCGRNPKMVRIFSSQKHRYYLVYRCNPKFSCSKNKKLTDSITKRAAPAAQEGPSGPFFGALICAPGITAAKILAKKTKS